MIHRSPYPPLDPVTSSLPQIILEVADQLPDHPALIDGATGATVTYGTLASRIRSVAAGLTARGFKPGDTLAIHSPNLPQWAGVALGTMYAGGIVTGINPGATPGEVRRQLIDSDASYLMTIPPFVPDALPHLSSTSLREVLVLGEAEGATPISDLLSAGEARQAQSADPDAVTLLPYSSGTTGLPKGVMLTNRNTVSAMRQLQSCVMASSASDTMLAIAPFAHVMGFIVCLSVPLASGTTVVTMPRFDPISFFELIQKHRITIVAVPPPLIALLAHDPRVDNYDLSSLDAIVCGGAPLTAQMQLALMARFPNAMVGQAWGLTESSVSAAGPDRRHGSVPGSVGRLMPSTELRVVDLEHGRDLGYEEAGELWIRGPHVMLGYLNNPDATAEMIDANGWLHTGDLGYIDAQQNVFIVDRIKELIKVNALSVAPAELETILSSHPQVADAAVFRRPDQRRGEVPVAVVVPRGEISRLELMQWLNQQVATYKQIRDVRFTDAIPRTPSGKILRRVLMEHDQLAV